MYSYTVPNRGKKDEVKPNRYRPGGTILVTTIHTHAEYDDSIDRSDEGNGPIHKDFNNYPSQDDRENVERSKSTYDIVVTPNGSILYYTENPLEEPIDLTDDIEDVYGYTPASDPNDPTRRNEVDPEDGEDNSSYTYKEEK